ncbi:Peptidase family M50 [uncultured archaeon]|nr:Peptidase family M50 [uncultured archaeon]
MDKIMIFDLSLLVIFCIWVFWFLHSRKKNLTKEGWMYLYKTQLGVKYIDEFSSKYSKVLYALRYPIILLGLILMGVMLFLLIQTVYIYWAFPQITQIIKAPPVMPLIPYFPQIFGVQSLMPPFYFTYFIVALLIVAVVHEFSHGIFMRLFKVRIKSTGFAFLGPILGAFVEQNDQDLVRKSRRNQMTVLAAGVFANILFAGIFFLLLVGFFFLAYQPAGYVFSDYAYSPVSVKNITSFEMIGGTNLTKVYTSENKTYLFAGNSSYLSDVLKNQNLELIVLYENSPAINIRLKGVIVQIDNVAIKDREDLSEFLQGKNPGDVVSITTRIGTEEKSYRVELSSSPVNKSKAFLGVMNSEKVSRGVFGKVIGFLTDFKDPATDYQEKYLPSATLYVYNLLWWIMMINLFVGLFNMLPLGVLDGGRFFYLGLYGLANKLGIEKKKSEKFAKKGFRIMSWLIGLIFVLMILAWIFALR